MTLTPNPITATLPAGVAMLRPWAAPITLRQVEPHITVLQRVNTLLTPTTLLAAVEGSSALDAQEIAAVINPLRRAVDALRTGAASFDDWLRLASVVNIANAIERQGVVRGMASELAKCEAAVQAIGDRTGDTHDTWKSPTTPGSHPRSTPPKSRPPATWCTGTNSSWSSCLTKSTPKPVTTPWPRSGRAAGGRLT